MSRSDGSFDEMNAPELTDALDELRSLADVRVAEPVARAHVAAAAAVARTEPATEDTAAAPILEFRRRPMLFARAAMAAAAAVAVMLTLAAADVLPRPVQAAVADVAHRVGIDLPDPDDDAPATDDGVGDVDPDGAGTVPTTAPASPAADPPVASTPGGGPPGGVPPGLGDGGPPGGGPPAGVPGGAPPGVPGPPEGVPGGGPPDGVPGGGPPEGVGGGPPNGGGGGPPDDPPGGPPPGAGPP